jgi:hypothetical protein
MLFRRAVASSNIRIGLNIVSMELQTPLFIAESKGDQATFVIGQPCAPASAAYGFECLGVTDTIRPDFALRLQQSSACTRSCTLHGDPEARNGAQSHAGTPDLFVTIGISSVTLPPGFDDVWRRSERLDPRGSAHDTGVNLFMEFRGRRSVLCVRYTLDGVSFTSGCSKDLWSVFDSESVCDADGQCRCASCDGTLVAWSACLVASVSRLGNVQANGKIHSENPHACAVWAASGRAVLFGRVPRPCQELRLCSRVWSVCCCTWSPHTAASVHSRRCGIQCGSCHFLSEHSRVPCDGIAPITYELFLYHFEEHNTSKK